MFGGRLRALQVDVDSCLGWKSNKSDSKKYLAFRDEYCLSPHAKNVIKYPAGFFSGCF